MSKPITKFIWGIHVLGITAINFHWILCFFLVSRPLKLPLPSNKSGCASWGTEKWALFITNTMVPQSCMRKAFNTVHMALSARSYALHLQINCLANSKDGRSHGCLHAWCGTGCFHTASACSSRAQCDSCLFTKQPVCSRGDWRVHE